jgi:Cu+-exporting ATPase
MPNMTTTTHRDPVCGMRVNEAKAAGSSEYQGRTYYFCGASCMAKFKADPDRYVRPPEAASLASPKPGTQQVEYTCPMHPEVRQMGPGTCPKCGMALEPLAWISTDKKSPKI